MKDKAIHDAMVSIENRVRHVYNQGFNHGFEEGRGCKYEQSDIEAAYQRGLDDAWKCMEKICAEVIDGGLDRNTLKQIFGTAIIVNIFKTNSASEAMAKLKEYEEKQPEEKTDKSCESCRFVDLQEYEFPCSACSASHTYRWEARKGAEE